MIVVVNQPNANREVDGSNNTRTIWCTFEQRWLNSKYDSVVKFIFIHLWLKCSSQVYQTIVIKQFFLFSASSTGSLSITNKSANHLRHALEKNPGLKQAMRLQVENELEIELEKRGIKRVSNSDPWTRKKLISQAIKVLSESLRII